MARENEEAGYKIGAQRDAHKMLDERDNFMRKRGPPRQNAQRHPFQQWIIRLLAQRYVHLLCWLHC
jgi:hypothetical protein